MRAEPVAETAADGVGIVVANDAARASFTMVVGSELRAVAGDDFAPLHSWPLAERLVGWPATQPAAGLALVGASDHVSLLDGYGSVLWSLAHPPWQGAYESGCCWFDAAGRPAAVVPAPGYDGCVIVSLDVASGRPLAEARIEAAPAGINPVHHPDGFVGLAEGEGQDAARAWWVRGAELIDPGWEDIVLADVAPDGRSIVTTPHGSGPLVQRSFPELEVLREVEDEEDWFWDFAACFAGEHIVARLLGDTERTVAIRPEGGLDELDIGDGWIVPAAAGSWLAVERERVRRWVLL